MSPDKGGGGIRLDFKPGGPTLERFLTSMASVQGLMGPIGAGKTSAVLFKQIINATRQQPSTRDGVRRYQCTCVHHDYRRLWANLIPSWWAWIPQDTGTWIGGKGEPAEHRINFALAGRPIELIMAFVALGENRAEDVLRGYETTAFLLNEADLLDESVLTWATSRVGRYPSMAEGGPSWYGVMMDFNAPDTENYLYTLMTSPPEGYEFFRQPGARSPNAENLDNLVAGYYDNMMAGKPDWWVRRMIDNEFGFSRDGKPVYPEYNDQLHCANRELEPLEGLPLQIGLDAGMTPAAAIGQRTMAGQWRIVDEIASVAGAGIGPNRMARMLNQLLAERYPQFIRPDRRGRPPAITGWADPSAFYGADTEDGEQAWAQIVAAKTGIPILPAPTNKLTPRLDAVRLPLERMIDGHHPGLIISPRCAALRKGFNSHYRYRRVLVAGPDQYRDEPEKNDHSHPHDALQYLCLGGGEYDAVMRGEALEAPGRMPRYARLE